MNYDIENIIQMPTRKFLPASALCEKKPFLIQSLFDLFPQRLLFPTDASHGVRLSADIVRGCQSARRHGSNKGPPGKHLSWITFEWSQIKFLCLRYRLA